MKSCIGWYFSLAFGGSLLSQAEAFLTTVTPLKQKAFGSRSAHFVDPSPPASGTEDASVLLGRKRVRPRRPESFGPYPLAAGLPEGDEGIADLESLANPAKDEEYGDSSALQYGVSGAAAGASDQFFSADTRVVFGVNALEIGLLELHEMGLARALIVTGWNQARADPVVWELLPRGFELAWYSVSTEPSLTDVAKGASAALEHRADCVVAMGGAAVMDAAKVVAAIAYADKDHKKAARRLLGAADKPRETGPGGGETEKDVHSAPPLLGPIPLVTIPVVAGVGSEVTPMATILGDDDPLEPKKVTLGFHSSAAAMPAPFMALLEPRLMMRVPLETTWPRAFVALAGCIEGYVAGQGFVPDLLSQQGIERVSRCLSTDLGFRGPLYQEREDIAFAGVVRGLVASRAEWSFLHQLASAVAVACGAPYAVCVARLFPRVLEAQISALRRDQEAFADPSPRRRRGRRNDRNPSASGVASPTHDIDIGQDAQGDNSDRGSESSSTSSVSGPGVDDPDGDGADERYDRACAALLKYRRVAGFVTGGGRGKGVKDKNGSAPEEIVGWLDARLLDKNVTPLYLAGLRPEHATAVVDTMSDEGFIEEADGKSRGRRGGRLGADAVRAIVGGESTRRRRAGDEGGCSEARERMVEATEDQNEEPVEELSTGQAQTGPWRK